MSERSKDRQDGKHAVPSYEREAQALREKTERLRALRLARDGAERPAETGTGIGTAGGKAKSGKAPARRKAGTASGTLSDWLKSQQDQGRRS